MNFAEKVRSLLAENGEKMNLTDEQKQSILTIQNAGNAEIYEGLATSVSSVEVAKAIEAAEAGKSQTNADVFAEKIDLATNSGHEIISCATSKATNVVTGDLKDATVWKLSVPLNVNVATSGVSQAAIRTDGVEPFAKKSTDNTADIIKKSSLRDFLISATVFPQSIEMTDELNAFMKFMVKYKSAMMAEFLTEAARGQLTGAQLTTIYRCASRALAEDIFDAEWLKANPLYSESDPDDVALRNKAKDSYMASLQNIGSKYLSNISVKFGMQITKLSIAPQPKWKNVDKLGHVKRFGPGKSFYVRSNMDSGIMTVPCTSTMLGKHLNDIILLTRVGAALIELEARKENGLTAKLDIPDYSSVKFDESLLGKKYYEILNISEEQERGIYEDLQRQMTERAISVNEAIAQEKANNNAATVGALLNAR